MAVNGETFHTDDLGDHGCEWGDLLRRCSGGTIAVSGETFHTDVLEDYGTQNGA